VSLIALLVQEEFKQNGTHTVVVPIACPLTSSASLSKMSQAKRDHLKRLAKCRKTSTVPRSVRRHARSRCES
jgi:hypothetical protein